MEPQVHMTEVETWAWQTRVESVCLRTMAEPERRRIQTETEWKVGAQLKTWKSEAKPVQRLTKVEPEKQGNPASLWDSRPHWSRVSFEPSLIQWVGGLRCLEVKGSMGQGGANDSKTPGRSEQLGGTTVGGAGGLKGDTVGKDYELDG